ncbi:glyoxylase I family protein [Actinoplanes campanulatus]|uniref:Glyoxylase I family protein n=1 Tax=Actinoplanes campanulatus TaxID=113559 RepID=A0A7W5AH52_9ACTN|nr:VOC family protein [Actinoplanes campanulatus]MBB3095976.1 glyoxylase I family protein [Actinoplanes campanulatus]GGN12829.1 glyoxalase [Actinoplanes campanulatus]GID36929.1 glyoxalase [Actinoplanes campanulatus]
MVRWAHVGLNCRDQETTERFYHDMFGFERSRVVTAGGTDIVFLRQGDVHLELFDAARESPESFGADGPQHPGMVRHLAFQVEDLDDFLAQVPGDLDVSLGPLAFDEFIPGWRTVWVKDPDGVIVEISQGYTDQPVG